MIRLLTFSTLYPNNAHPNHGIFVETRLRNLIAHCDVKGVVLAPVPFFPFRSQVFGGWSRYAQIARSEIRQNIEVYHPRYPVIPRYGMTAAPYLLYQTATRALQKLINDGLEFDLIDGHYLYPDGVAAAWLARRFRKPVVLTARGSDVSQLPNYAVSRRLIRRAIDAADGVIAVSEGIKSGLVRLGADQGRVLVLRNGVDVTAFRPLNRDESRAALGLTRRTLVSVGLLIERKGHDRVIRALMHLADLDLDLVIVGEGPERSSLSALVRELGLTERVHFVGPQPQSRLPVYYSAADAMVLASSREGWANVLLESMACGTPVVASNAWGSAEAVKSRDAGIVVSANTPEGIADGIRSLLKYPPNRAATRAYAEQFGWEPTSEGQFSLFKDVIARYRGAKESSAMPAVSIG
jgi:glycosyltransferase involved in cell wall biosynthesis